MMQLPIHANHTHVRRQAQSPRRQVAPNLLRGVTSDGVTFFVAHDGASHTLPGNGGLRIKPYVSEAAAIDECLRLAQVMTHKHALYHTGFAGAKLVAMGDVQQLDKQALLQAVGRLLNRLDGLVYTGCDLNTTLADMDYLMQISPYVLASVGTAIDPSAATGYGVFGSISAVCQQEIQGKTFLVHGVGSVGAVVAQLLVKAGGTVLTYDQAPARADLPGCHNLSSQKEWWKIRCDMLAPCSISGLITPYIAHRLQCRSVVGSANLPLAGAAVHEIFQRRRIGFVPEAISSAGAILCDSVEKYGALPFAQVPPAAIYDFVQALVQQKTAQFLTTVSPAAAFSQQTLRRLYDAPTEPMAGIRFGAWQATSLSYPAALMVALLSQSSGARAKGEQTMTNQPYDLIVIGGGPIGLAAAYYGAKAQKRVLVLERFGFFNDRGASGGESRQFRIQYNEKEIAQLVLDSLPLWTELQAQTAEELLHTAGCLWFGNPHVTGAEGQIATVLKVMQELKLPYRLVDQCDLEQRYGFKSVPSSYSGFFQPDGAAINYPALLRVLYRQAQTSGLVTLLAQQPVIAIQPTAAGVTVTTNNATYHGTKLIIAAGPYVNEVLGLLDLRLHIGIWEMVSAYFRRVDPTVDFPTWINFDAAQGDDPMLYYGFPALDWAKSRDYVKVAANYPVQIYHDLRTYHRQPDPQVIANISRWVGRFMPGLDPAPHDPSTCICAIVPEADNPYALKRELILDFAPPCVPHHQNIVIYATGWAAKIVPLIGKICVDLAVRGTTPHDITKLQFTEDLLQ